MEKLLSIPINIELITTIITGIFSVVVLIFQTNRKGKLRYITGERSEWRDQLRRICYELKQIEHQKKEEQKDRLDEVLVDLKTRLNAYGKDRKTDYLWDGHIWDVIRSIEEASEVNVKEVDRLIDYISLLLKYDWERAKQEARINSKILLSSIVFVISNLLFVYFFFERFPDSGLAEILLILLIFSLIYFAPSIIKHVVTIFPNHGLAQSAWLHWILLIIYPVYCFLPGIKTFGFLNLAVIMQGVAALIRALGEWEFYQKEHQYIKSVKEIQDATVSEEAIRRKRKKREKKKRLENEKSYAYKCKDICLAPLRLGLIGICYAWVLLRHFILKVVNKEYRKISEIQDGINRVKSGWIPPHDINSKE